MKKLFALLLAACLLMCPVTALAEEETIDIAVATVQAASGAEEATVSVSLENCAGMDSIQMRLNYDETAMRLSAVDTHGILDSGLHVLNTETSGLLILAFASAEGVRASEGVLFDLTFTLVNEAGSALTVTEVLATRYDAATGVQSKAYVTVTDGGVTFREDGTLPEARITPWPVETPVPTPEPTPEPTEIPVTVPAAAEESPAAAEQTETNTEKDADGTPMILIATGALAIVLFAAAAWLIIIDRKKKREAERRKAERMAARQAARRAARRAEKTAAIKIADGEEIEELLPNKDTNETKPRHNHRNIMD